MKYVLKKPATLLFMVIVIILGISIGYDVGSMGLLSTRLSVITVRILILISFIYMDFLVFRDLNSSMVLFRNKSLLKFFKSVIKIEMLLVFIFSLLLFIPIILLNFSMFLKEFNYFVLMIINFNVVMTFCISIVRLIDVGINKRSLSSIIFILSFIAIDLIMDEFYFDIIGLSSIFILPLEFNLLTYFLVLFVLITSIIMITFLTLYEISRKDYLIKNEEVNI